MPLTYDETREYARLKGFNPDEVDVDALTGAITPKRREQPTMSTAIPAPKTTGALETIGRQASLSVLPSAVSIPASIAVGGAVTAKALPLAAAGPWIPPVLGIAAGLGTGLAASMGASKLQESLLSQIPGGQEYLAKSSALREERPVASAIGDVAGSLPFMKVNPKMLKDAAHALTTERAAGAGFWNKLGQSEAAQNVLISGALGGAASVGEDLMADKDVNVTKALVNAVMQGAVSDVYPWMAKIPGLRNAPYRGQPLAEPAPNVMGMNEVERTAILKEPAAGDEAAKLTKQIEALDKQIAEMDAIRAEQEKLKAETPVLQAKLELKRMADEKAALEKALKGDTRTYTEFVASPENMAFTTAKAQEKGVADVTFEDTGRLTGKRGETYGEFDAEKNAIRASTYAGTKGKELNLPERAVLPKDVQAAPTTGPHETIHAEIYNILNSERAAQTRMGEQLRVATENSPEYKRWLETHPDKTWDEYATIRSAAKFALNPSNEGRSWAGERAALKRLQTGKATADDVDTILLMKWRYDRGLAAPRGAAGAKAPVRSAMVDDVNKEIERLREQPATEQLELPMAKEGTPLTKWLRDNYPEFEKPQFGDATKGKKFSTPEGEESATKFNPDAIRRRNIEPDGKVYQSGKLVEPTKDMANMWRAGVAVQDARIAKLRELEAKYPNADISEMRRIGFEEGVVEADTDAASWKDVIRQVERSKADRLQYAQDIEDAANVFARTKGISAKPAAAATKAAKPPKAIESDVAAESGFEQTVRSAEQMTTDTLEAKRKFAAKHPKLISVTEAGEVMLKTEPNEWGSAALSDWLGVTPGALTQYAKKQGLRYIRDVDWNRVIAENEYRPKQYPQLESKGGKAKRDESGGVVMRDRPLNEKIDPSKIFWGGSEAEPVADDYALGVVKAGVLEALMPRWKSGHVTRRARTRWAAEAQGLDLPEGQRIGAYADQLANQVLVALSKEGLNTKNLGENPTFDDKVFKNSRRIAERMLRDDVMKLLAEKAEGTTSLDAPVSYTRTKGDFVAAPVEGVDRAEVARRQAQWDQVVKMARDGSITAEQFDDAEMKLRKRFLDAGLPEKSVNDILSEGRSAYEGRQDDLRGEGAGDVDREYQAQSRQSTPEPDETPTFVTQFEKELRVNRPFGLQVGKDSRLLSSEIIAKLRTLPPIEQELLRNSGLEDKLKVQSRISAADLKDWLAANGPKVEVLTYGMEGKVSEAKREYDRMTHEWYDNLGREKQIQLDQSALDYVSPNNRKEALRSQGWSEQDIATGMRYLETREVYWKEPKDTSPRATSYYKSVSAFDTNEPMPEWTTSAREANNTVILPQTNMGMITDAMRSLKVPEDTARSISGAYGTLTAGMESEPTSGALVRLLDTKKVRANSIQDLYRAISKATDGAKQRLENLTQADIKHPIEVAGGGNEYTLPFHARVTEAVWDNSVPKGKVGVWSQLNDAPKNVQRVDVVMPSKVRPWLDEQTGQQLTSRGIPLTREDAALWSPDNLHENVPNTLGWAMIQYKDGPNGEKIAVIAEAQSRWGQHLKKQKGREAEFDEFRSLAPDHPLLRDYNRLILKAAIDQARKENATHIVVSDAETAMMTEGHDLQRSGSRYELRNPKTNEVKSYDYNEGGAKGISEARRLEIQRSIEQDIKNGWNMTRMPKQEGGMRFNYDEMLPRIARDITGDEGTRVSLGEHKNAVTYTPEYLAEKRYFSEDEALQAARVQQEVHTPDADVTLKKFDSDTEEPYWRLQISSYSNPRDNLIFRNADGSPKTDVSGTMFDISAPAARRASGEEFSIAGKRYSTPEADDSESMILWRKLKDTPVSKRLEALYEEHSQLGTVWYDEEPRVSRMPVLEKEIKQLEEQQRMLPEFKAWIEAADRDRETRAAREFNDAFTKVKQTRDKWDNVVDSITPSDDRSNEAIRAAQFKFPSHSTDLSDVDDILTSGLRRGSALDLTEDKGWAESGVSLIVPYARKGRHIEHNDYVTSSGVSAVGRVIVDANAYGNSVNAEVQALANKHPDVAFEIIEPDGKIIQVKPSDRRYSSPEPEGITYPYQISDISKQGPVERFAAQFDQVRKYDPVVADAFAKTELLREINEGQYLHSTVHDFRKEFGSVNERELKRAYDYALGMYRNPESIDKSSFTKREIALASFWNERISRPVREHQQKLNMQIETRDGLRRKAKLSEWYAPEMLNDKAIDVFTKSTDTVESTRLKNLWVEHVVEMSANTDKPISSTDARKDIDQFVSALGRRGAHAADFGALRKAAGFGLPEELRERNLLRVMERYARRASRDLAKVEGLEIDPYVRGKLLLDDPATGERGKPEDGNDLLTHEEVRNAMKFITGDFEINRSPRLLSTVRAVTNAMLGPMTGVRDTATVIVNSLPYMKFSDLPTIFTSLSDFNTARRKSLEYGARTGKHPLDAIATPLGTDAYVNTFNIAAEALRKYSGRDAIEQFNRIWTFAIGRELANQAVLTKNEAFLKKFGVAADQKVDGKVVWNTDIMAKNFTDRVQGSYGGRGLPAIAVDGMAAPWFALARWSLEKANITWNDVLKPAYTGKDFTPLLMYTVGAWLTGEAIEKLNEELQAGKKSQDASWKEIEAADGGIEQVALRLANIMQLGSFLGMTGDMLKMGADIAKGEKPRGYSVPLADFISDGVVGSVTNFSRAVQDGADPLDAVAALTQNLARTQLQAYRVANYWVDREQVDRSNKFRDLRVFKQTTGREVPSDIQQINPAMREDEREFKRSSDPLDAASRLRDVLDRFKVEYKDDPAAMSKALERLRRNSYQTFPSPDRDLREAQEYYTYLVRAYGKAEADARVEDYMRQTQLNRMKSTAIPTLSR